MKKRFLLPLILMALIYTFGSAYAADYVPPSGTPYVQFITDNGCPLQSNAGAFFHCIDLNNLPTELRYKGIVHFNGWTPYDCVTLKLTKKYTKSPSVSPPATVEVGEFFSPVTDGQTIVFSIDPSKMNKNPTCTVGTCCNSVDVGVAFRRCSNSSQYYQGPPYIPGLNINSTDGNVNCKPTAITLSSYTATSCNKAVILNWATETEINNLGFNILRAETEDGEYVQINGDTITAEGSATSGAAYKFVDTGVKNRKTYYYILEDLDENGTATTNGPVKATPRFRSLCGK